METKDSIKCITCQLFLKYDKWCINLNNMNRIMQNEANTNYHKCLNTWHITHVNACTVDFQLFVLLLSSTRLIVKSDAKHRH